MDKLSKEEVLHVADLGRLWLDEEEIEKFSYQLKSLFTEIEKVNEIKLETNETMISPTINTCKMFFDGPENFDNPSRLVENAPKKFDNFIEVAGVFDE